MRDSIGKPTNEPRAAVGEATTCDRSEWPVWVGRVGAPEPKADFSHLTPSERIALCWEATKQAWALTGAQKTLPISRNLADLRFADSLTELLPFMDG